MAACLGFRLCHVPEPKEIAHPLTYASTPYSVTRDATYRSEKHHRFDRGRPDP